MLRGIGLLKLQTLDNGSGTQFTITEAFDDGDACRVTQALKEVGFELSNGVVHIYIRNFEYSVYVSDARIASG